MGSTMDQRFIAKGLNPLGDMTFLAVFLGQFTLDGGSILLKDMLGSRSMADLTAGILEVRGYLQADKASRFAVSRGVATITLLDFLLLQPFS